MTITCKSPSNGISEVYTCRELITRPKVQSCMATSRLTQLLLTACCGLAGLPPAAAYAGAIYTWVDAGGVTHFSESPPPDPVTQPAMIELMPPPPPADTDDYYSIIRQAERMERRRLENEKLAAERLQAEAEARRARIEAEAAMQAPASYADDGSVYLPAYPYYPGHGPGYGDKPWRPGNRPPGHPGHWPEQPGYWPGQPGSPQPGPGFRPPARRVISAIPSRP
jgi:hypothetical protein